MPRLPLYDVHWTPAVVVEKGGGKKGGDAIRVGLLDGRILPLTAWTGEIRRNIDLYDVVYVRVVEGKGRATSKPKANAKPDVQARCNGVRRRRGAAPRPADRARLRAGAGEQDRPRARHGRAAFPIR